MQTKIMAITSRKGGVGKTTLSTNIGWIASELGLKTVVVDTDLVNPCVHLHLGLTNVEHGLADYLANRMDEVPLYSYDEMKVIPVGKNVDLRCVDSIGERLDSLLENLLDQFDVIVVDTPASGGISDLVLRLCREGFVVVNPDVQSIVSAVRLLRSGYRGVISGVIINKFSRRFRITPQKLEKMIGCRILGVIPEDSRVTECASIGVPVVKKYPRTPASEGIKAIVEQIFSVKIDFEVEGEKGWIRRFIR